MSSVSYRDSFLCPICSYLIAAFGGYQGTLYYATLISQEINNLSPGETALRFLPMGATGLIVCLLMTPMLENFNSKYLLLVGVVICTLAPLPSALMKEGDIDFWKRILPTSILCVMGPSIVFCTITVVLLESVPSDIQSLCGGMVHTAFQIGGGLGLAVTSAVVQSLDTNRGHGLLQQYKTGMWCSMAIAGLGMVITVLGVRGTYGNQVTKGKGDV